MSQTADNDRDLYTIPSSSSWFIWDEIYDIERRALPEFFDDTSISRNPRVYNEYRSFIINKYREDPSRRLTFTEVRKSLVGDVGSISKVFAFLDQCGLINFGVPARTGGPAAGPDVVIKDVVSGQIRVVRADVRADELGTALGRGALENGGARENGHLATANQSFTSSVILCNVDGGFEDCPDGGIPGEKH